LCVEEVIVAWLNKATHMQPEAQSTVRKRGGGKRGCDGALPPAPAQLSTLNTPAEAAGYLRVHESGLRDWIRLGRIRAVKLGRFIRIEKSELERIAREGL